MTILRSAVLLSSALLINAPDHVAAPADPKKKGGAPMKERSAPVAKPPAAPFVPVFWEAGKGLDAYAGNDAEKVFVWLGAKVNAVPGAPDKFSAPDQEALHRDAVRAAMAGVGPIPIPGRCWIKEYDAAAQGYQVKAFLTAPPKEMVLPLTPVVRYAQLPLSDG